VPYKCGIELNRSYRSLIATLISDGRKGALVGLWLDALGQLPAQFALAAAEQEATGPGALVRNRDFQCDVLRELFQQVRAASIAPIASDDPAVLLSQASVRDRAAAVRSEIVARTREWLAADEHPREVRELVMDILGPMDPS
jgi:hypothetical protein